MTALFIKEGSHITSAWEDVENKLGEGLIEDCNDWTMSSHNSWFMIHNCPQIWKILLRFKIIKSKVLKVITFSLHWPIWGNSILIYQFQQLNI